MGVAGGVASAVSLRSPLASTTLSSSYTQPARYVHVQITVGSTAGMYQGALLYIVGGGAYVVVTVDSSTTVTLMNLGCFWGEVSGQTVSSGGAVKSVLTSGLITPIYVSTSLAGGVPVELWSPLQVALYGGAVSSEPANNETHGGCFTPRRSGLVVTGLRLSHNVSRSIKISIWDQTGTRVATETATVGGSSSRVYTITFSTPYTVPSGAVGQVHYYGAWITDQSTARGVAVSTSTPTIAVLPQPQPDIQLLNDSSTTPGATAWARLWSTGDAKPTSLASGERYLLEPIWTYL